MSFLIPNKYFFITTTWGNGHEITLTFGADTCSREASSATENVKVISCPFLDENYMDEKIFVYEHIKNPPIINNRYHTASTHHITSAFAAGL